MTDITWTNDTRKLSDLVPWAHNPKRMTKKQAEGLRLSIERFGFAVPFLISPDGDIYDGHQRQALMGAIREYGPNATVDVRVSSRPLTDDERRELVVRLKQNQAGWDFDMLPNLYEKEELLEWGFEPEELGMYPDDAKPDDPGAQIDRAEELREKWGVETGQLWQLGEHRLVCGDCTDATVVARVMGGERADSAIADPPYNVGLNYGESTDDKRDEAAYWLWQSGWFTLCQNNSDKQVVTPGCVNLEKWVIDFKPSHVGVWDKGEGANTHGRVTKYWAWEPIMCHGKFERIRHTDVFRISALGSSPGHPCPKPIQLWEDILGTLATGQVIYEPFLGSGTTLIACERLGRRCRAVEISPAYCAVAIQRWVDMTGGEPVLLDS